MIISSAWFNELIQQSQSAQDVGSHLSQVGFETELLDDTINISPDLLVGEVLETSPHKNASKLTVCKVDLGGEMVQILCGCPTVKNAQYVIVAPVGTVLPGITIKEANIRGLDSHGMICSLNEIGIPVDQKGIFHLPKGVKVGQKLIELIPTSQLLDVDLTPNRGDCASVYGLARDYLATKKQHIGKLPELPTNLATEKMIDVKSNAVLNFTAAKLKVDMTKSLPLEISQRLAQSGIKLINPVVDLLNYTMLYYGQPMHAYDAAKLTLPLVAQEAEHISDVSFKALDEQTYGLNPFDLVICDQKSPQGLAGVIGADASKITEETVEVIIESATFDASKIAKTLRNTTIHSDSSYRFERGVAPELSKAAMAYVIAMSEKYLCAEVQCIDLFETTPQQRTVDVTAKFINDYLGTELGQSIIVDLLKDLGMRVTATGTQLAVGIPSFRQDIEQSVDLVEEVARLYGYNQIPLLPVKTELVVKQQHYDRIRIAKDALAGMGLSEILQYSYVSKQLISATDPDAKPFEIKNPINAQFDQMRTHLLQTLIPAVQYNLARQKQHIRIFEHGNIFLRDEDNKPSENTMLAGIMVGDADVKSYQQAARGVDYYDVKNIVTNLLLLLGYPKVEFTRSDHIAYHPNQSANVSIDGAHVGVIGRLNPVLESEFEIGKAVAFAINLDHLPPLQSQAYAIPSRYPSVSRDITLSCALAVESAALCHAWDGLSLPELCDIALVDVFDTEDHKNITYRFTFRSHENTISEKQIQKWISSLTKAVAEFTI